MEEDVPGDGWNEVDEEVTRSNRRRYRSAPGCALVADGDEGDFGGDDAAEWIWDSFDEIAGVVVVGPYDVANAGDVAEIPRDDCPLPRISGSRGLAR